MNNFMYNHFFYFFHKENPILKRICVIISLTFFAALIFYGNSYSDILELLWYMDYSTWGKVIFMFISYVSVFSVEDKFLYDIRRDTMYNNIILFIVATPTLFAYYPVLIYRLYMYNRNNVY